MSSARHRLRIFRKTRKQDAFINTSRGSAKDDGTLGASHTTENGFPKLPTTIMCQISTVGSYYASPLPKQPTRCHQHLPSVGVRGHRIPGLNRTPLGRGENDPNGHAHVGNAPAFGSTDKTETPSRLAELPFGKAPRLCLFVAGYQCRQQIRFFRRVHSSIGLLNLFCFSCVLRAVFSHNIN